jgi:alcohol dehydrogenase
MYHGFASLGTADGTSLSRGFGVARLPRIVFGAGRLKELPAVVAGYGAHALLVTGNKSLRASKSWSLIADGLRAAGMTFESIAVEGEPSTALVDNAVAEFRQKGVDVVVGIGGGSALDAAKAIAGLLAPGNSVLDHLEGVGRDIPYKGPATPFIAVPTTAGTGSEATKNAVLSVQGENGYKKSFRDDKLVAQVALMDPELLATCPPEVIAANGMDAFTQLLESYVSLNASPFTDALAWSGMEAVRDGFFAAYDGGDSEYARHGRAAMAYGSLLSGIALAQAGLGSVHGLASPLAHSFRFRTAWCAARWRPRQPKRTSGRCARVRRNRRRSGNTPRSAGCCRVSRR